MQDSKGFIKIHRKIIDWEWYSDKNVCRVFFHLIFTANYKDLSFKGLTIKRGQKVVSLKNLANEINISVQQLRTTLTKLKSTNEITSKSTNGYTIITLENYELYQGQEKESNKQNNKENNNKITNEQQTDNKRITTSKERKKERKEEINKKTKAKKDFFGFDIPAFIQKKTLEDFIENRKTLKKPVTENAMKRLLSSLEKLEAEGQDVNACIDNAILNGYSGVFPINQKSVNQNIAGYKNSYDPAKAKKDLDDVINNLENQQRGNYAN